MARPDAKGPPSQANLLRQGRSCKGIGPRRDPEEGRRESREKGLDPLLDPDVKDLFMEWGEEVEGSDGPRGIGGGRERSGVEKIPFEPGREGGLSYGPTPRSTVKDARPKILYKRIRKWEVVGGGACGGEVVSAETLPGQSVKTLPTRPCAELRDLVFLP